MKQANISESSATATFSARRRSHPPISISLPVMENSCVAPRATKGQSERRQADGCSPRGAPRGLPDLARRLPPGRLLDGVDALERSLRPIRAVLLGIFLLG